MDGIHLQTVAPLRAPTLPCKSGGEGTVSSHSVLQALRTRIVRQLTAGQGLAEYTLIVGLVALVSIAALTGFGSKVASEISQFVNSF